MSLQRAIGQDVVDRNPTLKKFTRHQQRSMTFNRVFLSTHQCDPIPTRTLDQTVDPFEEGWLICQSFILNPTLIIAARIFATSSQFFAQKDVSNTCCR
ncbi:hypothetical protein SYN63AY4M2_13395 [Synechococcus sp. 63AY4M2]|nr:hypothetical protein SYN63AY4M2_13395 [Synechococcus sp. 63AY4M2]